MDAYRKQRLLGKLYELRDELINERGLDRDAFAAGCHINKAIVIMRRGCGGLDNSEEAESE